MKAALLAVIAISTALAGVAQAQGAGAHDTASAHGIAPPVHRSPPGVLRIWGHPQAERWLSMQAARFNQHRPGIRIEPRLTGSDVGMAALYTGQADIVLMGRMATESEVKAFEWVYQYRPTAVPILTGSLDHAGQAPALVVFVHRDNPTDALTLEQLDGIFGAARDNGWSDGQPTQSAGRGPERDIRRWGQLGLEGRWAQRDIRLYAPMAESGTGKFFRARVLADSNRMHWDALQEFDDPVRGIDDSGARILAALASDPFGIAIANLQFTRPEVKPLLLSEGEEKPVAATRGNLIRGSYPLTRMVYAYINKQPGQAVDPQVLAWLQDVLGDATHDPKDEEGFLPLADDRQRAVLRSLTASQ